MADGLRKLRKNQNQKTPQYDCSNCKCKRYSPCGCMKTGGVIIEMPVVKASIETPEVK